MADFQDDDLEYLAPSFDPNSLTVPKLRSILVAHEIHYPSSAKKAQLIDLFNENIVPQAKRLLSARARTKRTSKGIADVPSSQEDDYDTPVVTQTPRRKSRKPLEADEAIVTRATPVRRSPVKQARTSVHGDDPEATVKRTTAKRTRQSVTSPTVMDDDKEKYLRDDDEESPFTQDNPFQSGSSPPPEPLRSPSGRKRETISPTDGRERQRKSSNRKSDQSNGVLMSSSTALEMSVGHLKQELIEPGEEFTSEEQIELEDSDTRRGAVVRRRNADSSKLGHAAKAAALTISVAMLGGIATVWRQEKLDVGYCGVGRPSVKISGVEIPEWADVLRPQCEPCPPHAYCYDLLRTSCEPGFMLQPHPLALNGLIPLVPTCEPDGEKARKIKAVADRAIEELRERNAKWECGDLKDDDGKRIESPEVGEQELKAEVSSKRRKGMSQEEFEDLWADAIGEVRNRDEVVSVSNGKPTLRSNSLARLPFACAIRRSLRLALVRHIWQLGGVTALLSFLIYLRWTITNRRSDAVQAKQLASSALDRLATQAARHLQSPGAIGDPWISMAQLRDDVLRNEFSAVKRQRLWVRVQKLVEDNANVRSMVREGRSGEVSRVWEWIGATSVLENDTLNTGGRKSIGTNGWAKDESNGMTQAETRHWDEGRPIY